MRTRLCLALVGAVICSFLVAPVASARTPVVSVAGGAVSGARVDGITQYLGVPFAQAARFSAPRPAAPWSGVRRATTHGPQCPQSLPGGIPPALSPFTNSENCLSVNLYVPDSAATQRLPVMVYLYGGAYVLGSNQQYDSPAEMARTGNVIIAVPNYRLGPFGFMALPELAAESGGATGTYGTQDQQFALRWVRDNIGRFGGDPNDVTLFGESAGAMSVCTQISAPGSRGLFQKAIIESGPCVRSPLVPPCKEIGYQRSEKYAASMGCADPRTRLACLRSLPIDKLLDSPTTKFDSPLATWTPFIDDVVLTTTPDEALRNGSAADIPLIIGSNADEGRLFVALFDYANGRIATAESFRSTVRTVYPDRADAVLAAYPLSRYRTPADALAAVYTDSLFACAASATTAAARAGGAAVFQYRFTAAPLGRSNPLLSGAFHASEIPFLFSRLGGVPIPWTGASAALARQMKAQWTTFARTGRPNGPGLPSWTPDGRFLSIDTSGSSMRTGFDALHHCGVWGA